MYSSKNINHITSLIRCDCSYLIQTRIHLSSKATYVFAISLYLSPSQQKISSWYLDYANDDIIVKLHNFVTLAFPSRCVSQNNTYYAFFIPGLRSQLRRAICGGNPRQLPSFKGIFIFSLEVLEFKTLKQFLNNNPNDIVTEFDKTERPYYEVVWLKIVWQMWETS